MNTIKITKRTNYETISAILKAAEDQGFSLPDGITFASLNDFVDHEVELLDKKSEAAAKRAATKRAEGDELRGKILEYVTDEFQTLAQITSAFNADAPSIEDTISPQKVTPRLTQLVKLGQVVKDQQTVSGGEGGKSHKVNVYKLA